MPDLLVQLGIRKCIVVVVVVVVPVIWDDLTLRLLAWPSDYKTCL